MDMWLVAGLGNPGPEYELSPHNIGFLAVDRLAERNQIRVSRPECQALIGKGGFAGQDVILAKPQTYMNLSGPSVKALLAKYEIPLERLVVVQDDLDLPWRSLRIRPRGSPAGHNGMKSLVKSLGSIEFTRVRVGVHPGQPLSSGRDYLLSPVGRGRKEELDEMAGEASLAVESIIADGVEKAMTKHNRRAGGLNEEER